MTPHTHHWLGAARRSQPRPWPPAPSPDTGRLQRKGVRAPHSLCGRCSRAGHPVALGLQGPPRQQAHWAQHTGSVSTPPQRPRQAARWTGMESSPEPASHPLGLPLQPHPAGEGREVREGEGGEHQPTAQHCPGGGSQRGLGAVATDHRLWAARWRSSSLAPCGALLLAPSPGHPTVRGAVDLSHYRAALGFGVDNRVNVPDPSASCHLLGTVLPC